MSDQGQDRKRATATPPARREFLKQVATAAGVGAAASGTAAAVQAAPAPQSTRPGGGRRPVAFPRVFEDAALNTLGFPLGGVGTGAISLGGRGQLEDWEIFNRSDKGAGPEYGFASIWARAARQEPVARVLESRLRPPYEGRGHRGLGITNVPGLPRLDGAKFTGEFPFASIDFEDAALPVEVRLEAFNPFIPLNADDSGLPVAILRYKVRNNASSEAQVSVSFNLENPVGEVGRTNSFRDDGPLGGLLMTNPFLDAKHALKGSFAVCATADSGELTHLTGWRGGSRWRVAPLAFWDDFSEDGRLDPSGHTVPEPIGSVCATQTVGAGEEASFTFILAWHFPNRTPDRCGWRSPEGEGSTVIGNYYCTQFDDAWAAARHTADRLEELEQGTREFLETMKRTSLPPAVLDAAMSNLSTLHTNTCFRTADGAFHGFEGCFDQGGCCFGSCTHVWNYESALAFLFPEFSRSLREYQFGWATDERGVMDFRYYLPYGKRRWGKSATDGQMGVLMKLYLDWKLSGDDAWLGRLWPSAKRALEFSWVEKGWDADRDGVMEGVQHNTYDVEFFGPNPLSGIWYLGALRACEEMARAVGDNDSAGEYRRLFDNGSRWIDDSLFNGEFYIQKVQGRAESEIAEGLTVGMGASDSSNPDFQMGEGCLADQLLAQYFARIVDVGDLVDSSNARQTLESIHRYNFKSDLSEHESVQRVYAVNDDAGLLICDYAGRPRPKVPFPYYAEVWTGIEYQVAAHMFFEGLYDEGLEIVEAVRQRHDGERRNPWNEPECGHHYARALASWSAVLALCGFNYSAVDESLVLKPRMKGDSVTGFWSIPSGWGSYTWARAQGESTLTVETRHGKAALRQVEVGASGQTASSASVSLGDEDVNSELSPGTSVRFERTILIEPAKPLRIRFS